MKGIREAALSTEEEEPKKTDTFDSERYGRDYYGGRSSGGYSTFGGHNGYYDDNGVWQPGRSIEFEDTLPRTTISKDNEKLSEIGDKIANQIRISLTIPYSALGGIADEESAEYDMNKASDKAEVMSREALVKLAGADFQTRYSIDTEIEETYDEFEFTFTLNPITKLD